MQKKLITIQGVPNVPAVLYGDSSDELVLFVHGKMGSKYDGERCAELVTKKNKQLLAFDLPGHGDRQNQMANFKPWCITSEIDAILEYADSNYKSVELIGNSIGCYFTMLSSKSEILSKRLLICPILDMERLIMDMMTWANVTEDKLKAEGVIETSFGDSLDYDYLVYARENPIVLSKKAGSNTHILYAGKDGLTSHQTVTSFSTKNNCELVIYEEGEHWFHTPEQLEVLDAFVKNRL